MTAFSRVDWTPSRLAAAAIPMGGLYALGAVLPFWFLTSPEAGAAFFPSAGLTVGVLLLTPRRTWPVWMAAAAAGELLVDLTHGQSVAMAMGFVLANIGEPLVGATVVRRSMRRSNPSGSVRRGLLLFVVGAAFIGPLFGALVGATVASTSAIGPGWVSVFGRWWLGDALGVIVIATPLLAWSRSRRDEPPLAVGETVGIAGVATAITVVPALLWDRPLIFAVLPVLLVAALRGGDRAVTLASVGVAFVANWAAVTGRADEMFPGIGRDDQLVQLQLFLGVTILAALVLSVEVDARRRTEEELREAEVQRSSAEVAALQAATLEQRRIGREVHDIVGHALNVVLLQAAAARRSANGSHPQLGQHLASIEEVSRRAFADLDVALGLVDRSPDLLPAQGLSQVPDLVETMRKAGMAVELETTGCRPEVSTIVDWSAYRIIQESLTNVAKHAPRAHALVTIDYDPECIRVAVVDDGTDSSRPPPGRTGRGLIGIRERASVLGGDISFGPVPSGGFAVRVSLPLMKARA